MNYLQIFCLMVPELLVVFTGLGVIALGIAVEKGALPAGFRERLWQIGSLGLVIAGVALMLGPETGALPGGMLVIDPLTRLFKGVLLVMSILTLALASGSSQREHVGEYLGLILFATAGLLLIAGSEDLLMIFLSLEMVSLCLYILAGFQRNKKTASEAAMKYFLFGAVSAAFMLYGLSLIYGYTHATSLKAIQAGLQTAPMEPLLIAGLVMTVAGFGFKVAAAPFHLWAPDVYQGAPLPSAALIAAGSKVAGFFIVCKVLMFGLGGLEGSAGWTAFAAGWVPLIAVLAAISMTLGNLTALAQGNVRRLLAYSAIAHAGYLLVGTGAATAAGLSAVLFYVVIYGLSAIGAFGVVGIVERRRGGDRLADFAGLSREMPGMALCLLIFMTSLAGIPPLAGFFGKFYLFSAALKSADGAAGGGGMVWLVALAIAVNAISLYYYLRVLKEAYVRPVPEGVVASAVPFAGRAAVALAAIGVVTLGICPSILLTPIETAVRLLF